MRKFLLLIFSFVLTLSSAWAQERMISGKVTSSEDGSALPGVNVVLKGTRNGTVTDADGVYKLTVPAEGGTLVFSFIGLETREEEIGTRNVVDLGLGADVKQLSEVVVTAVGIQRESKSLGYAVQRVKSDQIVQKSEPDLLKSLQGKVPGLIISGSGGLAGSSTRITIRGVNSFTGNNQPLFVVDGIPYNNDRNDTSNPRD